MQITRRKPRHFLQFLVLLVCFACAKQSDEAKTASAAPQGRVTKGVWMAGGMTESQTTFVLQKVQELGLNTVALNTSYATVDGINAFAKEARAQGVSTHAWVETGLKTSEKPQYHEASLYLSCSDSGADVGVIHDAGWSI